MAYSNKVHVILFRDVPPALRVPALYSRMPADERFRCLARARGDTGKASKANVPKGGGYQCGAACDESGLCIRHLRLATEVVQRTAAALMQLAPAARTKWITPAGAPLPGHGAGALGEGAP